MPKKPIVLSISGHDPSGGAGIQADIETLNALGCWPCSIISCLTVQDSSSVQRLIPLAADDMIEQAEVLFNDLPIAAIKIGLCGSLAAVTAIEQVLRTQPNIPVIFDPVLACGDGRSLASNSLIDSIKQRLIPLTTVLTPNSLEAAKLCQQTNSSAQMAKQLLQLGADYVLITGGHQSGEQVNNQLFHQQGLVNACQWPRQTGEFHGTGCTLASAIAAFIALGKPISEAVEQAQAYTNTAIKRAQHLGQGQAFLSRL
ncbi:bifunctional hydroxymethylpyrimidine kinase/phosphomethylpyrimidine kinase [Cycloclasticus sp. 46_120_T64]|nr:bifunctional hydroxymethylpyrimidine kinase/phosphomethylpyrimidine kinase [Cycloclasticus sp. 46_120_T64]